MQQSDFYTFKVMDSKSKQKEQDVSDRNPNNQNNPKGGFNLETSIKVTKNQPMHHRDTKKTNNSESSSSSSSRDMTAKSSTNSETRQESSKNNTINANTYSSAFKNTMSKFLSTSVYDKLFSPSTTSITEISNSSKNDSSSSQPNADDNGKIETTRPEIMKLKEPKKNSADSLKAVSFDERSITSRNSNRSMSMDSMYKTSVNDLWDKRNERPLDITQAEDEICKKYVDEIVNLVNNDNEASFSKLSRQLSKLKTDLKHGWRENLTVPRTKGIENTKLDKLQKQNLDEYELLTKAPHDIQSASKEIANLKDDIQRQSTLKSEDDTQLTQMRAKLEQKETELKIFQKKYNEHWGDFQKEIAEEIANKPEVQKLQQQYDQSLENILAGVETIKEELQVGNKNDSQSSTDHNKAKSAEDNQSYIDQKKEKLRQALHGGKLTDKQQIATGLSTRQQPLNVRPDAISTHNLRTYYVIDHVALVTLFAESDKHKFTDNHKERLLSAITTNAENLHTTAETLSITDDGGSNRSSQYLPDRDLTEEPGKF